jgi:hypothetical protein
VFDVEAPSYVYWPTPLVQPGDSGAWVTSLAEGDWYGMVFARSTNGDRAYACFADELFTSARSAVGSNVEALC